MGFACANITSSRDDTNCRLGTQLLYSHSTPKAKVCTVKQKDGNRRGSGMESDPRSGEKRREGNLKVKRPVFQDRKDRYTEGENKLNYCHEWREPTSVLITWIGLPYDPCPATFFARLRMSRHFRFWYVALCLRLLKTTCRLRDPVDFCTWRQKWRQRWGEVVARG